MRARTLTTVTIAKHRICVGVETDEKLGASVVLTVYGPRLRCDISSPDTESVRSFVREIREGLPFFNPRQRPNVGLFADALERACMLVGKANA